jgi:hypothetical protein
LPPVPRHPSRVALAALALTAVAAPAATAHPARLEPHATAGWQPGIAAARAFAATRQGVIAFGVRTDAGVVGMRLDRPFPSASVVKAMLLVAYLRQRSVRNRALRGGDRALLAPMITRSDNAAASAVRNRVGNAGLDRLARRVGMTRFHAAASWGSSAITVRDQTRLFLHVDAYVPRRHRRYALRLLHAIVPEQRWGIARAVPTAWTLGFKGGWGAGTGAVEHQAGLLRQGGDRVAIAVLTVGNPSHAYGTQTEEGVARRLLRGLDGRLVGIAGDSVAALAAEAQ